MTRAERAGQPDDSSDALAADSRERAVTALLRVPTFRRLWTAQCTTEVGDRLGLLVLLALVVQAAAVQQLFGGGYRGIGYALALVFGLRFLAAVVFGALLLGPLTSLTSPQGVLDRRWTMIGADGARLGLFVVAPLWIDWLPGSALSWLLITVFLTGVAERLWTVARDGAAPALLPSRPADGVRPAPDHLDALRRLDLRTGFLALPVAALGLIAAALLNNVLGVWLPWFGAHHVALASYIAAGLFAASVAVVHHLDLPKVVTPAPRSPLQGLRLPKGPPGAERGRTGALPVLVLSCAAVAGAIAAAGAVAVLQAADLGGGPTAFGLLALALSGGTAAGIRTAPAVLPAFSRRRLLGIAIGVTGVALLLTGLVPDPVTVLLLSLLAGYAAGVAARCGHLLIDQEADAVRRPRTTAHLHAVARVTVAVAAVAAPVAAALIGTHRLADGRFTFAHGGAAFTLMLVGALLLPVAALVLGRLDDRDGVPLRRDLLEAVRGAEPAESTAPDGFFLVLEGGDGAGKSTQAAALAEWIRAKGHEVVVTREPGATSLGKRLRSILLDVSGAGVSHRAEALLYAADRAEHVDSVVRPALERGAIVISDRYTDSSVAYQGAGRDLAPTEVARISRWATGGLVPHLTILLDIAPDTARERFTEAPDRLEAEPPEFHDRVRRGFLTLAAADPGRYLVLDAAQEPDVLTRLARQRLEEVLPLSAQEIEARAEAERLERLAAEEARRRAEEEAAAKAEAERLERERQEQAERLERERAEQAERENAEQRAAAQAEAERLETERREQEERRLAEERAAEEERLRLAEQERLRAEHEQEAERTRRQAEEQARLAERERDRRAAEERAHAEEQQRLRRQKAEQDRLRAEAEARRQERMRLAEQALLRAEQAREAARQAGPPPAQPPTVPGSPAAPTSDAADRTAGRPDDGPSDASDSPRPPAPPQPAAPPPPATPPQPPAPPRRPAPERPGDAGDADAGNSTAGDADPGKSDAGEPDAGRAGPSEGGAGQPSKPADRRPEDHTAVLPAVPPRPAGDSDDGRTGPTAAVAGEPAPGAADAQGRPSASHDTDPERTARTIEVPRIPDPEQTAILPRLTDSAAPPDADQDGTVVLPAVDPTAGDPADRVPSWLFRDEPAAPAPGSGGDDRTRELPRVSEEGGAAAERRRPRPHWAEETPLDDLPTLADELLGEGGRYEEYPERDRPSGADPAADPAADSSDAPAETGGDTPAQGGWRGWRRRR